MSHVARVRVSPDSLYCTIFQRGGCLSGDHVFKTVSLFEQFPTISVRLSGIDFVYISSNFHNWRHFFHFWHNSSGATPIVFPISQCKTNGFGCPCFIRHSVFITAHFMRLLFGLLYYSQNAGFRSFPNSHCVQKIALLFPRYNLAQ
jgi:hypothetical protein